MPCPSLLRLPARTDTHSTSYAGRVHFWMIFGILVLFRIPFLYTHHIQEDAYITFRSAFHLADFGRFSYNITERLPGVTSMLYGLLVALVRVLARGYAIPLIQLVGTCCCVGGTALFSAAVTDDRRTQLLLFTLLGSSPAALLPSYTGMEIPLLILDLGACLYSIRFGGLRPTSFIAVGLLPLVRPDAIVFAAMIAIAVTAISTRRTISTLAATVIGVGLLGVANFFFTSHFLTGTISAKAIHYRPSHSLPAFLRNVCDIFLTTNFMNPLNNSTRLSYFGVALTVLSAAAAFSLWNSRSLTYSRRVILALIASGAFLTPICYAIGGIMFPWYLWTSSWLATGLFLWWAAATIISIESISVQRAALCTISALIAMLAGLVWLHSLSMGLEDFRYRADVGRYIASKASPGDTLFLEPAGYIPYYAGIYTADEVGLVSAKVVDYHRRYPTDWWIEYVKTERPSFLVERDEILVFKTYQGYQLSNVDRQWFIEHYSLVASFRFSPSNYERNPWLLKAVHVARQPGYYVFRYHD